ncbi:hypothetical protein BDW62DRAFT_220740 [Aspergillus aurantiobrunneus]
MLNISVGNITSSSFDSLSSNVQDSVSKRRRHAMYFHRPPVWRYSSFQDGSSSPDMSEDLDDSDTAFEGGLSIVSLHRPNQQITDASAAPYMASYDSDSDHETPLLEKDPVSIFNDELTLFDRRHSTKTSPAPLHQEKPVFCTRLHSYKDIRLGLGEHWAIQEGSLVIGLDPEYTLLDTHERRVDEFNVSGGDIYVVCSLYADLWALCAKLSFSPSPEADNSRQIAFLPLCAITLAPNYSAFVQRCIHHSCSHEAIYPMNGLPVMPPRRSHSLTASKQIFRGPDGHISLPLAVQDVFRSLALKHMDDDFVPLDSTFEPIFLPLTSRRRRLLRRIETARSLSKYHNCDGQQKRRKYDHDLIPSFSSVYSKVGLRPDGWRRLRRWESCSSGNNQKLKRLLGKG